MLTRSTFEMKNRRESYEKEAKKEIMSKCIGGGKKQKLQRKKNCTVSGEVEVE